MSAALLESSVDGETTNLCRNVFGAFHLCRFWHRVCVNTDVFEVVPAMLEFFFDEFYPLHWFRPLLVLSSHTVIRDTLGDISRF